MRTRLFVPSAQAQRPFPPLATATEAALMARERFDEARPVDAVTSRRLPPSSGRMRRGAVLGPAPPPPFYLSLSRPPFSLGDPPDPVQAPFCSSHMWGVSLYPTRMNQPVNARIFVPVPRPPRPPSPSRSLAYLCPIAGKLAPFSASRPPGADFSGP